MPPKREVPGVSDAEKTHVGTFNNAEHDAGFRFEKDDQVRPEYPF